MAVRSLKLVPGEVYYHMSPKCVSIISAVCELDAALERGDTQALISVNRKPDFRSHRNLGRIGLDRFEHLPVIPAWERHRSTPLVGAFELAGLTSRRDEDPNFYAPKVYGLVSRYGRSDEWQHAVLLGRDTINSVAEQLGMPNVYRDQFRN
jgi:hypothetical protein